VPKLHVELDGPIIKPGVLILKDGSPLNNLGRLDITLAADMDSGAPHQTVSLTQFAVIDGLGYRSDVSHTITKATLTIEYVEA